MAIFANLGNCYHFHHLVILVDLHRVKSLNKGVFTHSTIVRGTLQGV